MPLSPSSRLLYLSSFEYPSTHAHPLHALSMAQAFARIPGMHCTFFVSRGVVSGVETVQTSPGFFTAVVRVGRAKTLWTILVLSIYMVLHPHFWKSITVFSNDIRLIAMTGFIKRITKCTIAVEIHGSAGTLADRRAVHIADSIFFVTEGLYRRYVQMYPEIAEKAHLLPNAVDINLPVDEDIAQTLRVELGFRKDDLVIGYVGRFNPMKSDKGIFFMIDALTTLDKNVKLLLVGGMPDEILAIEKYATERFLIDRVMCVPFVPFSERAVFLSVPDILAYVPPSIDVFLREETSPMKLYEYAVVGKPIIASDTPAFREALGEQGAFFIAPGSLTEFVNVVNVVQNNPEQVRLKIKKAQEKVRSWDDRAQEVLQTL